MIAIALPAGRRVEGTVRVPPSKSATNRALILAAQSEEPILLRHPLQSADTEALVRCLKTMDVRIRREGGDLRVCGPLPAISSASALSLSRRLDAGESGTACRFLLALAAATPGRFLLDGAPRLRERPVAELVEALRALGARISYQGAEGFPPVSIEGEELDGGAVSVDASRSSQFLSALLLVGCRLRRGLAVTVSGTLASAPYVGTTLETLRRFGVSAEWDGASGRVRPGLPRATEYEVPGDYSSAVPLAAAAAVSGGRLTLKGLRDPSPDADRKAFDALAVMGAEIRFAADAVFVTGGPLRGREVAAREFPDAVPALAGAAAFAEGETALTGLAHLRIKESDRLAALVDVLGRCGVYARAEGDSLFVEGVGGQGPGARENCPTPDPRLPTPILVPTYNDHRIAMAAAILSLRIAGLLIEEPGCVAKSYPDFFADLGGLLH